MVGMAEISRFIVYLSNVFTSAFFHISVRFGFFRQLTQNTLKKDKKGEGRATAPPDCASLSFWTQGQLALSPSIQVFQ